MRLLMTSVVALAGIVAGAGAASACDFYHQQVMASAAPAAPTEQVQPVAATKVDPWVLAYLDKLAKDTPPPATSQDTQVK
jgi:Flp pilus assembly protein CpaB